jgi:hypothetical protein
LQHQTTATTVAFKVVAEKDPQEYFHNWYGHWQKCVTLGDNHFKDSVQ